MLPSYSKPTHRFKLPTVYPRSLQPLGTPPPAGWSIPLGEKWIEKNKPVSFAGSYTRTTHIIPAAHPRVIAYGTKDVHVPLETAKARRVRLNDLGDVLLTKKVNQENGGEVDGLQRDPPRVVNVVDRYYLREPGTRPGRGLTLVVAHANGFPRRIWEPVLETLLQASKSKPGCLIEEVWSFESATHGDSAVLNGEALGDLFDWLDNSRDMLNLLLNYVPSKTDPSNLPLFLSPVPQEEASARWGRGITNRTVIALGHSLGGTTIARAVAEVPALWSSLILVDPVILPHILPDPSGGIHLLHMGALNRRSRWSSKEEACKNFEQNKFFKIWHPKILEIYVNEGICEDEETGGVRLKTSGYQEAVVFAERRVPVEVWELLPTIDDRIPIHWILSGRPPIVMGPENNVAQTVWRRETNVSNVRIPGAGHLVVHEAPETLAMNVLDFLTKHYGPPGLAKL